MSIRYRWCIRWLEDQWSWSWIWQWVSIGSLREVDGKNLICIRMESVNLVVLEPAASIPCLRRLVRKWTWVEIGLFLGGLYHCSEQQRSSYQHLHSEDRYPIHFHQEPRVVKIPRCTPIQQQTVNLLQFNWLHQLKHERWCRMRMLCASQMHHYQWNCTNTVSLRTSDSLSMRTNVSQFVSQWVEIFG